MCAANERPSPVRRVLKGLGGRTLGCLLMGGMAVLAQVPGATEALPAGTRLETVAATTAAASLAKAGPGRVLAYVDRGLQIQVEGRPALRLDSRTPSALAWSPDGETLAAAFPEAGATQLCRFPRVGGAPGASVRLPGRVNGLAWASATELLAFGVETETYRFGTRVAEVLHRWDGATAPEASPLFDTTLIPSAMAAWGTTVLPNLTFELSPLQDEILYARLHAPPALDPRLRIVLRHLATGREREVAEVSLLAGPAQFTLDGARVVVGDGQRATQILDPWGGAPPVTLLVAGRQVSPSPAGHLIFADGRLFEKEHPIGTFAPGTTGTFMAAGDLLLARQGRLQRLAGLGLDSAAPLTPERRRALRTWRRWLAEGIIGSPDYASLAGAGNP